jgi:hypothetical protein
MKPIIVFFLGTMFCINSYASAPDTIYSNDPLIEYTGRIDFSNPLAPVFSYSGVSIRACFTGSSISVMLNDEGNQNFYYAIVDGVITSRIQTSAGLKTYFIAEEMKDTIHEVEIFRLTELTFGKTQFCGFIIDRGNSAVEITNKRTRLIEFIGNSITCGYGNEGLNGGSFGPTTENHYLTYAAITSRSFRARHLSECRSGIGIYRNYDGPVTGSTDVMPTNYTRIFLYDENPKYKFAEKPDLICIDLGTNDFSTSKGDSARYVSNYIRFVDSLHVWNKQADILCLIGPMMSGNDLIRIKRYLKFVVDSTNKKGNGKASFFEMSQQTGDLGIGIDYHPTVAQHIRNGIELTNYISKLKGWPVAPMAVKASVLTTTEITINFNTVIHDTLIRHNNFAVASEGLNLLTDSAFLDKSDKTKIHILLTDSIRLNQKVSFSYIPGAIESKDNLKLGRISSFTVDNILLETKIARASTNDAGSLINIVFNKNMIKPANLNGIKLFNKENKVLEVDSFKMSSKNTLQLFLKNKIYMSDTIYLTVVAKISGLDGITVTSIEKYKVTNYSTLTGISQKTTDDEFVVFPNPLRQGKLNYRLKTANSTRIVLSLFDLRGNLIFNTNVKSMAGTIDLGNNKLLTGSYILQILTEQKKFQKLIVL